MSELLGTRRSFNVRVKEAPRFYAAYVCGIVGAGLFVLGGFHLVSLTILVEVVNALMLPFILGFLFLLALRLLPAHMSLKRWDRVLLS